MTDYTNSEIDQMIDEILTPETDPDMETRTCIRCLRPYQAKVRSYRKYCPDCLKALRQIGGRNGKPNTKTKTEPAPEPAPEPIPTAQLTVGELIKLIDILDKDCPVYGVDGIEFTSVWSAKTGEIVRVLKIRRDADA